MTASSAESGIPNGASTSTHISSAANDTVQDHPDGAEIRRQVEFYFSDENLPTDKHLLQCCNGRENDPVSINRICGFSKMRKYKPKTLVVQALRLSAFLEVSEDGKKIKRKVPLQGKCLLDPDFFDDEDIAYDPRVRKPAQYPVPLLPQKKAKYPEGVSKNMLKATGFEKTYIEPLLKPEEAAEEEEMYAPEKHFIERIELAIQRFKQTRRMHEMYSHVFSKLMRFGGVESGQRMYQGISRQEMNGMNAEEIAKALAIHNVPWDRSDERQWIVDFAGICKAFLSSWYPAHYGYTLQAVKNACQVPRAFFKYLRFHNVCPEYDDQLAAALQICDTAEEQLPKVNAVGIALPGHFNKSASVVFGGVQAGIYTGDKSWAEEWRREGMQIEEIGIREEVAKVSFGTGLAIMGTDEQFDLYESSKLMVLSKESAYLEVVAIHLPSEGTRAAYAEQGKLHQCKLDLTPLGMIICKTWYTNDCEEYDLPKDQDKYPNRKPHKAGKDDKELEFWVEEDILVNCFVGMKLDADIIFLSGGLTIIDDVKETMSSFYTWLPNELWMERKPKEVQWLPKGMGLDDDEEIEINGEANKNAVKNTSGDEFDDE
ncbi:hypothetical protein TW65_06142 [Stemphylium lycopersici]|nr:hypothetical protein TW65_06142 [Stemphylium lycopersici]